MWKSSLTSIWLYILLRRHHRFRVGPVKIRGPGFTGPGILVIHMASYVVVKVIYALALNLPHSSRMGQDLSMRDQVEKYPYDLV